MYTLEMYAVGIISLISARFVLAIVQNNLQFYEVGLPDVVESSTLFGRPVCEGYYTVMDKASGLHVVTRSRIKCAMICSKYSSCESFYVENNSCVICTTNVSAIAEIVDDASGGGAVSPDSTQSIWMKVGPVLITTLTSPFADADTLSRIFITMIGRRESCAESELTAVSPFQRGQTDYFYIYCPLLMHDVQQIRLRHSGDDGWNVFDVTAQNVGDVMTFRRFECNFWVDDNEVKYCN